MIISVVINVFPTELTYDVELECQAHFRLCIHLAFIYPGVSRLSKFNQQGPIVRVIRMDDLESLVTGVGQHSCRQYVQIPLPHPRYLQNTLARYIPRRQTRTRFGVLPSSRYTAECQRRDVA